MEQLFVVGALITEVEKDGYTALMYAAYYGLIEFAKFFLSHGADPMLNPKREKLRSPLRIRKKTKILLIYNVVLPFCVLLGLSYASML